MKFNLILLLTISFQLSHNLFGQDKLFYNRVHYFEHQECQHPIGTIIQDKVFYSYNSSNTSFMNFNNTDGEIAKVDLINYGEYTSYNQFLKNDFINANKVMMGYKIPVESQSKSITEARSRFKLKSVKDTLINEKTLKHIRIEPKDTLIHRFKSYNIIINTATETELPLYTSPEVYFLLKGSLKDLRGIIVETFFIDLEGYWFCRDVLTGFEVTNKRVITKN